MIDKDFEFYDCHIFMLSWQSKRPVSFLSGMFRIQYQNIFIWMRLKVCVYVYKILFDPTFLCQIFPDDLKVKCPISWGYRIHQFHLCRGVISVFYKQTPPISVLAMTLNNLMVRVQSWSFGWCGLPLHCSFSQFHSDPEW